MPVRRTGATFPSTGRGRSPSGHLRVARCFFSYQMKILLVEDDENLAFSVSRGLKEEGYDIILAPTAADARQQLGKNPIDLILLDLGLPDDDGMNLLAEWRAKNLDLPIIIVSARSTLEDKVKGLDIGADDYIVKPFEFEELVARIRSRARGKESIAKLLHYEAADLVVDLKLRKVTRANELIDMSPREFDLLAYLLSRKGQVVSRDMISKDVWKVNSRVTSLNNAIDVYMSKLREKIDKEHDKKLIKTIRGVGFKIE